MSVSLWTTNQTALIVKGSETESTFNEHLSKSQQEVFYKIAHHLQIYLRDNLLSSSEDFGSIETARLILKIVKHFPEAGSGTGETFFLNLLRGPDDVNAVLEKVLKIVEGGLGKIFFLCASTQKNEYYGLNDLMLMVESFNSLLVHVPQPAPHYNSFQPYDQGGKEALAEIIKDPKKLNGLVDKGVEAAKAGFLLNAERAMTLAELAANCHDFSRMKSEAMRYLTSLKSEQRLGLEIYSQAFNELQNGEKNKHLTSLEKKWIVILILVITTNEKQAIGVKYTLTDIGDLIREAVNVHNFCGDEVLISFCKAPELLSGASFESVIRSFKFLVQSYKNLDVLDKAQEALLKFENGVIKLQQLLQLLEQLNPEPALKEAEDKENIDSLYKRFEGKGNDPNVVYPLPQNFLEQVKGQYVVVQKYCKKWEKLVLGELIHLASSLSLKAESTPLSQDEILQLVAIGRLALRIKFNIYLYNTQIFTVLAELVYPGGAVAQVKTGEGKSMIVALSAFVLFLQHRQQGHIISSSDSLATRDQKHFSDFFKAFGIKTAHICKASHDDNRFKADILYGTAADFEFAIMREMLTGKPCFPPAKHSKPFCWVYIDEMDNLTIDTALSGARLAFPAEVTYDWVYVPILQFIRENSTEERFKMSIDQQASCLRDYLKKFANGKFADRVDAFSDKKLLKWLQSGFKALYQLHNGKDYTIGFKRKDDEESGQGIIIVDFENTGKKQYGMRWSHGLHEFVEAKHGLDVETESITPITINHPVFYQMYRHMYGITGTIGSNYERDELKAIYGISSFDVPTHNPPKRKDLPTLVLDTDSQHLTCMIDEVKKCIASKRPILVLCETIMDSQTLEKNLRAEKIPCEMLNEEQEKSEADVIAKAGFPGAVTIATNVAGRGTDIKPSPESLASGGLHVLITFYPESDRVEMQARGRGGRQGQDGSSQIMFCRAKLIKTDSSLSSTTAEETLSYLKEQRQKKAVAQKTTHLSYAIIERFAFNLVADFYRQLNLLQQKLNEDNFLTNLARYFDGFKLLQVPAVKLEKYSPKNRVIIQQAILLLNSGTEDVLKWKGLVLQIANRLRDTIVNVFALNFNMQIEEIIAESGVTSRDTSMEVIRQFMQSITSKAIAKTIAEGMEKASAEAAERKIEGVKKELTARFNECQGLWRKYLNPQGHGIVFYLSELLDLDLHPTASNSYMKPLTIDAAAMQSKVQFDYDYTSAEKQSKKAAQSGVRQVEVEVQQKTEADKKDFKNREKPIDVEFESFLKSSQMDWEEEVALPDFRPGTPMPVPPQAGIQVKLKNFRLTCWLNSVLKFIGCTPYYDAMLVDAPPQGKEKLQGFLREVIICLRTGKEVSDGLLKALIREINKAIPNLRIGQQQDAPELLIQLTNQLLWKPSNVKPGAVAVLEAFHKEGNYPRLGMTYEPLSAIPVGWRKLGQLENFQTHVDITIPASFKGNMLDLGELIKDRGVRQLRLDRVHASVVGAAAEMNFTATTHFVCLPKTIMVYIKRFLDVDGVKKRVAAPLELDQDQLICLTEYTPTTEMVENQLRVVDMNFSKTRYYRIGAAVIQTGEMNTGHYTCMERAVNGTVLEHNDSEVNVKREPTYGQEGYFLRLDLVR
jgi:preprotein translocase subunit SecA